MVLNQEFKHVSYLWDERTAERIDNEIDLLIYRSNILGADLRITNFGGGNTSCKTREQDPLSGELKDVMWVKGSGGDIGTLTRKGLAGLYLDRLHALKKRYRGLEFEDEMVGLFYHCIYDLDSKAPSIDTPLHAFLPFTHIDHLHPDAVIALAAARDGEQIVKDLFNGSLAWIPWQRPGFDLGLKLEKCIQENPNLSGIVLGGHGLFTWGPTSYECYMSSLSVIERASAFLASNYGKHRAIFGGEKIEAEESDIRKTKAAAIAPILRGLCSSDRRMIGHFTDDERVLEFVNSQDLEKLASMGTSCPDHFLRTKIRPLVLDLPLDISLEKPEAIAKQLTPQVESYRRQYQEYYNNHKYNGSPAVRDPNPVVILWPGIGMFTFAKDKQTARVSAEFYINAINVMKGAEAISSYTSLPRQEAFNIEYWLLEEAKLSRMPKPKPLTGRIALITGSGGGIGKAIARKLIEEGCCVIISDNDIERLRGAEAEFRADFGKDVFTGVQMDVTDTTQIKRGIESACIAFGGVDIVVNNAGLSISKKLEDHSEHDWDLLYDVLVKGQFLVSQACVGVMKSQCIGGDIVNIVSKNALVSGPNNAGYGSAKAAQLHLSRLNAAELGTEKIRVNVVNPDAVIADSKIWEGAWAEGRARAYGVTVAELPAFYAKRTLLNEIILPEDVANACFVLVGGQLKKSTGNVINVDGGVAAGFVR